MNLKTRLLNLWSMVVEVAFIPLSLLFVTVLVK